MLVYALFMLFMEIVHGQFTTDRKKKKKKDATFPNTLAYSIDKCEHNESALAETASFIFM